MKKKIAVITWDAQSVKVYADQVKDFFGDEVDIVSYNVQDGSASHIAKADLFVVSTCAYDGYKDVNEYLPLGGDVVIVQVTIHRSSLYRLLEVPRNTNALMVNINPRMTTETMAYLNKIGVNNINFIPCYPGIAEIPQCDLAVTPGEARYVPKQVKEIIDIGPRVLSPDTIVEIALKLRLESVLENTRYREYVNLVVDNDYNFRRLFNRSMQFRSMFEILQSILDVGVIGTDDEGVIFAFNQKAEYVTGKNADEVLNQKASVVLPYLPFAESIENLQSIPSRLVKINDVDVNVSVTPVERSGACIGAFAMIQKFSDAEYKQHQMRVQLMSKGHASKYTFEDIVGESPAVVRACTIARQMANSNGAVLITGESGTGKELFAHAVHASSPRSEYPFVAINCAAIPDNLLESELFGYEEGAFTGAKKGGKMGYFEFAHKGTLFLDEIEGMSPLLQLKLLRVIQEKEVMRVGGKKIVHVDVRIVAATNENLVELVQKGEFRKDLYYRLAVLPIELPPLRERGRDVLLLLEKMILQVGGDFTLTQATQDILLRHGWDGNIRELNNCVEYLACLGKKLIEPEDLPPGIRFAHHNPSLSPPFTEAQKKSCEDFLEQAGKYKDEHLFILNKLAAAQSSGQRLGRKSLAELAKSEGLFLSEQEIRTILSKLEVQGLVKVNRGRGGTGITALGIDIVHCISNG